MTIPQRIEALRRGLSAQGWDAAVITGTDPHDSEYLPPRWETRAWISGFTGSAGLVVVTPQAAGLWTDGRYHTQAEAELAGTGIELFREGLPETPTPTAWLAQVLPRGARVGFDARTVTEARRRQWVEATAVAGLTIEVGPDLLEGPWADRPGLPSGPIVDYQGAVTGLTPRATKVADLRQALARLGAEALVLTSLDDLAWLANLRGSDIDYSPLFLAWGWIGPDEARLYLTASSLTAEARQALEAEGFSVHPYQAFEADLLTLARGRRVLVDPARVNAGLVASLAAAGPTGTVLVEGPSPTVLAKARKTAAESAAIAEAHRRDGAALVEFLAWFEQEAPRGRLTETSAAEALDGFRRAQEGYRGPSFTAIPGFRGNGAIIHYHASGAGAPLDGRGLFLLDTGAQYLEGTTDVTRTLVIGTPEPDEVEDYTLVLKAHLQVSLTPFPVGTRGYMLDAFARRVLWKTGRQYHHGTGHGVGHYLSVHEGPARINSEPIAIALEPGMVLSNEPGLYRPGLYGIRIENLVQVAPGPRTAFAAFLGLETLTLCPYERRLIDASALDDDERAWVDAYHARVWAEIGPRVGAEARRWLEEACRPLESRPR